MDLRFNVYFLGANALELGSQVAQFLVDLVMSLNNETSHFALEGVLQVKNCVTIITV
jgi:hypothetical protein